MPPVTPTVVRKIGEMPLVPATIGRDVDERHVLAGLLADPQRHVVDARHARRAHAHGALLGDEHDPLVGVLRLEIAQAFLLLGGVVLEHALAVQLTVRAGVGVAARGEEVGRDVADARRRR